MHRIKLEQQLAKNPILIDSGLEASKKNVNYVVNKEKQKSVSKYRG